MVPVFLALALGGLPVLPAGAHHGPPHDEIDEFATPASRRAVVVPLDGVSWPAAWLSVALVAGVWAASRKWGVDAATAVPVPANPAP